MDASQANSMLNSFDEEMEDFELEVSHREGTQLITFILGSEKYGLKILKVRELISYPEVMTRIPGMPDFIVGMINLRGLVIPVIDLRPQVDHRNHQPPKIDHPDYEIRHSRNTSHHLRITDQLPDLEDFQTVFFRTQNESDQLGPFPVTDFKFKVLHLLIETVQHGIGL